MKGVGMGEGGGVCTGKKVWARTDVQLHCLDGSTRLIKAIKGNSPHAMPTAEQYLTQYIPTDKFTNNKESFWGHMYIEKKNNNKKVFLIY